MKKIYLGLLISVLATTMNAQVLNLEWAQAMGGTSDDRYGSHTLDAFGNIYVSGVYQGMVDFDPGAGTFNLTSNGGFDIFIQKLDASGNFIWAKSMGGTGDDYSGSITTDASGNVYLDGIYEFTADFDPGAGTFNLTSNGDVDVFILKLDAAGNFAWAKSIGGTNYDVSGSITVDASGNIYIVGVYWLTVDFDPGAGAFNLTSNGVRDIFILKLDAAGNFVWVKSVGGIGDEPTAYHTTDALGNLLITGVYSGTVDFDPGAGTFNLTSSDIIFSDFFIQKLDTNGNFIWAKSMGGSSAEIPGFITTDISGNILITGWYFGTSDFDPGAGTFNLTSNGLSDVFIQKLDSSGNFIWAKSMGGTSIDLIGSVTTDASGNVYEIGTYQGTVDFDPGVATFNLSSKGLYEVFIQKLDASGSFIWAKSIGGIGEEFAGSISVDTSGNLLITGSFQDTVDLDPSAATSNFICKGIRDGFILKLSQSAVGIRENISFSDVTIFPNPNSGLVNIDLGNLREVSIKVLNVSCQLIYQAENVNALIHQFELSEAAGIYFIEISVQGERQRYKLVKE
ncbi:MAG: T9SS type A sorting domain-containing protein [Bacteroidetes bacterium]|nr:T9SS type A sorting domain-containing protein [Bacteroidota bacterium]